MRKPIFLSALLFLICFTSLFAQDRSKPYNNSFGGIIGFINGFSYKGYLSSDFALQCDAGLSWNWYTGVNLKGAVNFVYTGMATQDLFWFVGGGMNIGVGVTPENIYLIGSRIHGGYPKKHYPFFFGLNLIGGIEYKVPGHPIALQVDVRPGFYAYTHKYHVEAKGIGDKYSYRTDFKPGFDFNFLNFSVRYTISKHSSRARSSVKRGGSIKTHGKY